MIKNKSTIIFTDGASRGNPGPGGWGTVVFFPIDKNKNKVLELGGSEKNTTNNKMEMTAVINGLKFINDKKIKDEIIIYTDSSYVVNGITKWIFGWIKNNWKTKNKEDVLNKDLWKKMFVLTQDKKITWKIIKGHSGISANERCDDIATSFADGLEINLYNIDAEKYPISMDILTPKVTASQVNTLGKNTKNNKKTAYSYISSINGKIMIHKTWLECEKRVKGKSGALYKKSLNKEDEENIISKWKKK